MDQSRRSFCILALLIAGSVAPIAAAQESDLTAAEQKVVAQQIATLKRSSDRHVAESWSNSKKVAELICRPAALPILKKQDKTIDRVFLGTSDPKTLTLESNQKLTGSGEYRTPQGWTDFTFTCEVNPDTGKATAFEATPAQKAP